ncbi:MAG: ribose-phosphate diphosphokinase, partial [Chloroflexota bacterium]|nr:ribose-phosphate diphosphokinase [Chloroflexota bacterium]
DIFRTRLRAPLAIISKRHPEPDETEVLEMVGDVEGKVAVIVDDMISTGGTLAVAADMLIARGARKVVAAATHGIFAGEALNLIQESSIEKVYVSDSLPFPGNSRPDAVEVVSIAPMLAEAIMRIHTDLSISALFS